MNGDSLLIDGEWRGASATYERSDPANLERTTGTFAAADLSDVKDAFDAAAGAAKAWAATPMPARSEILRKAADLLEGRAEEATDRLIADMGKARRDAAPEVMRSVAILRYYAGELLQPSGERYPSSDPSTTLVTVEQPVGVVCAITPWNFPFAIPTWKIAPALGFGNSVVWKPAEIASGSAVVLADVLVEAGIPEGALSLLTGHGKEISAGLTGHDQLSALTFTGSGGVGRRLREAVADRNVKVQLELGGKNPAIVLSDADLADAAVQVTRGAMLSTGQRCTATSRAYVERSVLDEFTELLKERVDSLVVGDPSSKDTDVGPLASIEQRDTVASYLEIAENEGAEVITGGSMLNGCYVEPTLLTRVAPESALMREEIFGPVLIVQPIDGFEEGVAAANDTQFGLSAALFTRDLGCAMRFVEMSESGLVHINRETAGVEPQAPFGGVKGSSSMSREQGKAARQFFTTSKTAYIRVT